MSALDQFADPLPEDDDPLEITSGDLPPGEAPDDFDAGSDEDPFIDDPKPARAPSEDRDWEAEAKAMGWKDPKDTGRGVDAKSFVLRSGNEGERLLSQVDSLTQSIHEMRQEQRRNEIAARAEGYKRAMQAIKAEQMRAKESLDVDAMQVAHQREMELIRAAQQEAAQIEQQRAMEAQQQADSQPDPVWDAWQSENRWYGQDPELTQLADDFGAVLAQRGLRGRQLMDQVTTYLRGAHPDKFSNQRRRSAPMSDSNAAGNRAPSDMRSMPAEVRAAFNDFYEEHASEFKTKELARKYFMQMMGE